MATVKPGYKTTEFLMTLACLIAGVFLIWYDKRPDIGEKLILYSVPAYALARGLAKRR